MHIIKKKPPTKVLSQRINLDILQTYLDTKSECDKLLKGKINTAKYIEELLVELTLDMQHSLSLNNKQRNPLDTIKSLQSDLENPNWF